jgi:hypothetical protein
MRVDSLKVINGAYELDCSWAVGIDREVDVKERGFARAAPIVTVTSRVSWCADWDSRWASGAGEWDSQTAPSQDLLEE